MDRTEQDRQTIERVQAGDTSAFKVLIETYKNDALALACSIVKDQALAEDILQDVFITVFDKIKTFNFKSSFYTWLYRIVVNRSYNVLRKQKTQWGEQIEISTHSEEAARLSDTNDRREIVNFALTQMKPDEALVLRLFYLSELNIEEVIHITGFSKSKVKVTLHRGRKNLADLLKKHLGGEIEHL